jgi:YVTN family beta-propeller protein
MSIFLPRNTQSAILGALLLRAGLAGVQAAASYQICVPNEKSGDITVIDGASLKVVATIPVGKRPRGIHASPDGKTVYVALSGTPISGPPQLDPHGNPILNKGKDDDDDDKKANKSADGIVVVDLEQMKLLRKIRAGSVRTGRGFSRPMRMSAPRVSWTFAAEKWNRSYLSTGNRRASGQARTVNSSMLPARQTMKFSLWTPLAMK